jgi:multiple sugar transport system substrate-binding protein
MSHHLLFHHARAGITLVLAIMVIGFLAACGGSSTPATPSGPVTINFWSWVPNLQTEVDLFNQSHPNIKVKLQNVGAGGTEYTKLTTALKAGSGGPDVVQIEFQFIPQYVLLGKLVDLSQYGANNYQNDFVPWTWSQVVNNGKVYAIPQDSGPMGILYREDIFKKYNLQVPTTWAQYAQEAVQLHKANPKIFITDFPASDGAWFTGLVWQAGSQPFVVNGTNIKININDAPALQVANYWGNLIKQGVLDTEADFATDWYGGLSNGTIASWVTAAWAPTDLASSASKTTGLWRAAPLPQWTAGLNASSNWGGSTDAVTTQSKYPAQAALFAEWLNTNQQSVSDLVQKAFLFPTQTSALNDPSFSAPVAFYGNQAVNQVFAQSSQAVNKSFQWSPFQNYVYTQLQNQLASAVSGKITFAQALQNTQTSVVSYAQAQGFTVTS